MARIARVVLPEIPHHVVQRGVRSMQIFRSNIDRQHYLQILQEQSKKHGVTYLGWCLMTNHVHLIAIPHSQTALARAIGESHRRYTRWVNIGENVRGYLFQGRFFSCPLDDDHTIAALRYIERNPVRAGLVDQAWNHAWSSARFHVGVVKTDPLIMRKAECVQHKWREMLTVDPNETEYIRFNTRTGRPCGSASFMTRAEACCGRTLKAKPVGRPKPGT